MKARPLYSAIYGIIVFVAVLAIFIQYEQARQQHADMKAEFNSPEYRTFSLQMGDAAFVSDNDVRRLLSLAHVETAWGTSEVFDVTNTIFTKGYKVGVTHLIGDWDSLPISLKWGRYPHNDNEIILPYDEYIALGFDESGGLVQNSEGRSWVVVGVYETHNKRFPLVGLLLGSDNIMGDKISVVTTDGNYVQELSETALNILGLTGNRDIGIDKSSEVNKLGGVMQQSQARYVVLVILTILSLALLIGAFISILMVNSRKEEFGRRRVLGASRQTIFFLLISQTLLTVTLASLAASLVAFIAGIIWYPQGIPNFWLFISLDFSVIFITSLVQVPAGISAVFRNPVDVLRTP